jgi:hypothetical protein
MKRGRINFVTGLDQILLAVTIYVLSGRIVVHICTASPATLLITLRGFCHSPQANDEIAQGHLS